MTRRPDTTPAGSPTEAGSDFKEKLRSLSFPRKYGETERRPVINENDGSVGGHHTIRWDGSQDAEVIPKTFKVKTHLEED